MLPDGYLVWNISNLSKSLYISKSQVRKYFNDGRKIFSIIEMRLAREVICGRVSRNSNSYYDISNKSKKYECRNLTKRGVYYCPSSMVGSGRKFEEEGFLKKLEKIDGYILTDITKFPKIPYYIIESKVVKNLWHNKKLGLETKVNYVTMLKILDDL